MKTNTEAKRNHPGARANWITKAHLDARTANFMGHLCAVRAGLALRKAELIGSGIQFTRRGGCDVCLQP